MPAAAFIVRAYVEREDIHDQARNSVLSSPCKILFHSHASGAGKKPARQPDHERPEKAQKRPEAHKKMARGPEAWKRHRKTRGPEKAEKRFRSPEKGPAQKRLGIGPGTHKRPRRGARL